jgi:hypothetical protein
MGMGVGGYIYLRPGLHDGSISIGQDFILTSQFRRKLDIDFVMLIPADHLMVFAIEWDDLFGANRHGDTAVLNEV